MIFRLTALLLVAGLAGCTWEGRPDGASAVHSASDGFYDAADAPQGSPLGGDLVDTEVIEPLDAAPLGAPGAPVDLTQPPPTTGTADDLSPVEEALTPGTDR